MAFRFIHTADWHIGKAFGSFEPDKAALLRDARLSAVERIAAEARARDASCILVAGDIFDSPGLSDAVLRKLLSLLKASSDLSWHLLPGNHDPDQPRGVWERIVRIGVPANVVVHRTAEPYRLADDVILLPAPLDSKRTSVDPTAWFDQAEHQPRDTIIGLAHGSTRGFGGQSEASVLIAPERVATAGLDYLALGDWHGTSRIADKVWYSGTPEPEGYVDNDPGNVLVVSIPAARAMPEITPVPIAQYHWQRRTETLGPLHDSIAVLRVLEESETRASRRVIRLDLKGELTIGDEAELRAKLEDAAPAFFHLDVRWRDLVTAVSQDGADVFESDVVGGLAQRLQQQSADSNLEQAATARRALRLLATLALHGTGRDQ